jgi:transcriptional regulator with XRE-family HTH domain
MALGTNESDDAIGRLLSGFTKNPRLILVCKVAKYLKLPISELIVEQELER